jgi:hypothetical protein
MMKVSSTPAQVSALDTWLQGADAALPAAAAHPGTAVGEASTAQSRDSAEGLLDLNVWNGSSAGQGALLATAVAPQPTDRFAQAWSDHIFRPLQ